MSALELGVLSTGAGLVGVGVLAPIPLLSDAGYAFLGVIVSAVITTAGGVMVAYISVNARRSREDHSNDRDDRPDDRDTSREKSP